MRAQLLAVGSSVLDWMNGDSPRVKGELEDGDGAERGTAVHASAPNLTPNQVISLSFRHSRSASRFS